MRQSLLALQLFIFLCSGVTVSAFENRGVTGLEHLYAVNDLGLCAITQDGLRCWQSGQGQMPNELAFADADQISAGLKHFCALKDGQVSCWGDNTFGQLDVPPLTNITKILSGPLQTCAQDAAGKIKCWGFDEFKVHLNCMNDSVSLTNGPFCGIANGMPVEPSNVSVAGLDQMVPVYFVYIGKHCDFLPRLNWLGVFIKPCRWQGGIDLPSQKVDLFKSMIYNGLFCHWDNGGFSCNGPTKGNQFGRKVTGIKRMFVGQYDYKQIDICYQTENEIACTLDGKKFYTRFKSKAKILHALPYNSDNHCAIVEGSNETDCRTLNHRDVSAFDDLKGSNLEITRAKCWVIGHQIRCSGLELNEDGQRVTVAFGETFPNIFISPFKAPASPRVYKNFVAEIQGQLYAFDRDFYNKVKTSLATLKLEGAEISVLYDWLLNLNYPFNNELFRAALSERQKELSKSGLDLAKIKNLPTAQKLAATIIAHSAQTSAHLLKVKLDEESMKLLTDEQVESPQYSQAVLQYLDLVKTSPHLQNRHRTLVEMAWLVL